MTNHIEALTPISHSLRETILSASSRTDLSIDPNIQSIIFDSELDEIFEGLLERSLDDAQRGLLRERARIVYVLPTNYLKIDQEDIIGKNFDGTSGMELAIVIDVDMRSERNEQDKFYAGVIHTHGPLSGSLTPDDLFPLLINSEDPEAAIFSGLSTPLRRTCAFRTSDTPILSKLEAHKLIENYNQIYKEYLKQWITPNMSNEDYTDIQIEIGDALLNNFATRCNLKIFNAFTEESAMTLDYYTLPGQ